MNFAKFHARGGRGLQRAHPEVGIPLPPAHPRRGRGGTAGGAGCATAGGYPAAGAATGRGATYDGAARARRGRHPKLGGYGAHVGRGYRARANTGAGGYLCQGGAYTGARLPRRAARRHSLPRAGWLPGGCTPGEDHCFPSACDGFSPHQISVCVPPARLPGGAAQKNIFSGARVFVPEYRPRAYCALI